MELRSQSASREENEYHELKLLLTGLGFYENNMVVEEMKDILKALNMSENSCNSNTEMMMETEMDFDYSACNVVNSTTIESDTGAMKNNISPSSSPETDIKLLTVRADVHHDLNWTPLKNNQSPEILRKRNLNHFQSPNGKRLRYNSIEDLPDSGLSLTSNSSDNSSGNYNLALDESINKSLISPCLSSTQMEIDDLPKIQLCEMQNEGKLQSKDNQKLSRNTNSNFCTSLHECD